MVLNAAQVLASRECQSVNDKDLASSWVTEYRVYRVEHWRYMWLKFLAQLCLFGSVTLVGNLFGAPSKLLSTGGPHTDDSECSR